MIMARDNFPVQWRGGGSTALFISYSNKLGTSSTATSSVVVNWMNYPPWL